MFSLLNILLKTPTFLWDNLPIVGIYINLLKHTTKTQAVKNLMFFWLLF